MIDLIYTSYSNNKNLKGIAIPFPNMHDENLLFLCCSIKNIEMLMALKLFTLNIDVHSFIHCD